MYLENKISIKDVSNLIYLKDGKLVYNYKKSVSAKDVKPVNLNGINIKDYLCPEIVAPIKLSKGCYWNKCAFCSIALNTVYSVRDMDSIIQEIKYLKSIGINTFEITDESLSPVLLDKFSDTVLKNKLNIRYMVTARFEKEFTKEIFKKAYKSGLRFISWGFETASKRIHKLINKSDAFEKRLEILKNAYNCGIYNQLFIFHGFPTSTLKDELETLKFVEKYYKIIGEFAAYTYFSISKGSIVEKNPQKFGITELYKNPSMLIDNYNLKGNVLSDSDKKIINETTEKILRSKYNHVNLVVKENKLLYVCHYGAKNIRKFILNNKNSNNNKFKHIQLFHNFNLHKKLFST